MRVILLSNNGKEAGLAKALLDGGVDLAHAEFVPEGDHIRISHESFDVLLVDYPMGWGGLKLAAAQWAHEQGKLVCSYPHGANVLVQLDGIIPPCPYVDVELVPAPGHKETYRRMGYPTPCEVVGWYFCEQQPFRRVRKPRRVLFAPAHPFSADGGRSFVTTWQEANRRVWEQFTRLDMLRRVHLYGTWEANGISPNDDVDVSDSNLSVAKALEQIDWADVVIADPGTFSHLSVARGKPTLMFGQWIHPHSDLGDRLVENWDAWRVYARFPVGAEDGGLEAMVRQACEHDHARAWRRLFVGEQTSAEGLRTLLARLLEEKGKSEP